MTYSYFWRMGLAWQWPFLVRPLPLIIVKCPSCDFLEHLFIICIIHLISARSGLLELINFPYSWITYIERLEGRYSVSFIVSATLLGTQLGSRNKWWLWNFRQETSQSHIIMESVIMTKNLVSYLRGQPSSSSNNSYTSACIRITWRAC